EEADTSPNPIELSYESTIVEDIKELVFRARTMNGALVEARRPQQSMEAVEPQLNMLVNSSRALKRINPDAHKRVVSANAY
ncbi:8964_t:CDS:2, partial [Paraglomus brasilianum]